MFVAVAFLPNFINSKTLPGASILLILDILIEDDEYASFPEMYS